MWTTLRRGNANRNARLAEDVNNGDAVTLRLFNGELVAFRAVTNGGGCDGFATVVTTNPDLNDKVLETPESIMDSLDNAFANFEVLKSGTRVLVEEGAGMAQTTRVVPGNYRNGDPLTVNTDGRLRKAATGEIKVAEARETRNVAADEVLYINFDSLAAYPVP